MKCPVCKDVTLLMSQKNWVEIDYCPECRWIWLDRWELEKLISLDKQYNSDFNYNDTSNINDKNHYNGSYNNHNWQTHKKKSIFESFDFFD